MTVCTGDRGIGDHLVRDYCSGKEDREWAVKLPNESYTVKVVMVDAQFAHFATDIYLESNKLSERQSIKVNEPLRTCCPGRLA
jgi:cytochrome c biogenesis protein ResB